jgi:predicted transcriptional regulator
MMTTEQVVKELELKVFTGEAMDSAELLGGYVSDLLSDVMGHAREGVLWITLQSHVNVVAIASLKELAGVLLVKGIEPDSTVLEKAREEGVVLLGTSEDTFTIAGKLYQLLKNE